MSFAHVHLLLNHFPVVGSVLSIMLLALALARRSSELAKVALGFFALLGALSIAVFLTGEPAEALIETVSGFSEAITERHEEVALLATIITAGFGALALLALAVYRRRPLPRGLTATALVAAIGVGGIMGYTANLGGQVRHTEIRSAGRDGTVSETPTGGEAPDRGERR